MNIYRIPFIFRDITHTRDFFQGNLIPTSKYIPDDICLDKTRPKDDIPPLSGRIIRPKTITVDRCNNKPPKSAQPSPSPRPTPPNSIIRDVKSGPFPFAQTLIKLSNHNSNYTPTINPIGSEINAPPRPPQPPPAIAPLQRPAGKGLRRNKYVSGLSAFEDDLP
ncbi:hypothetical protein GWI33_010555 [Rhynchophorus ferrugineus]|uniref:Uncharacterized protein n=1 Tax=Rhynchophorus ferrugineus TaxID=354439 RepID=A0A834IS83_RHYFE|nr:hypothetical protein GWI33_010555 [Rhynchophorus ferrugineus]